MGDAARTYTLSNLQTPNSVARPRGVLRSPFRGGFGGSELWRPSSSQKTRLGLQPIADDPSTLLTVAGPTLWEAIIGNVFARGRPG
jgi:hypothetical protein